MFYKSIEEAHNNGEFRDTFYYQLNSNKSYDSLAQAKQKLLNRNQSITLTEDQKKQITKQVKDLMHILFK